MRTSFLLVVLSFLAFACNKPTKPAPTYKNTLSTTLNGTAFLPSNIEVSTIEPFDPGVRTIFIEAKDINEKHLILAMEDYDGTKSTFTVDQNYYLGTICLENCGTNSPIMSTSNSGEIKISSFDKTSFSNGEVITGTFRFETSDGKYSVTNGNFSVLVPNH